MFILKNVGSSSDLKKKRYKHANLSREFHCFLHTKKMDNVSARFFVYAVCHELTSVINKLLKVDIWFGKSFSMSKQIKPFMSSVSFCSLN